MTNEELIKKLRDLHRDPRPASAEWLFENQVALYDAAAAIEALLESVGMLAEQRSYWIDKAAEYYNQLPKRGEWICSYPEIEPNPMFMYGICSICGFEQSISNKLNYCPNCGAKMEVQE